LLACSLARKKFCTRPIWDLRRSCVTGSKGGGALWPSSAATALEQMAG
jgi:hypothetical protein